MKEEQLHEMGQGKILPLLLRYAWPALATATLNLLYNVVDRIYIGQGCGEDAIAGLALTFPFFSVIGAVGALIGVGSAAVISIHLGEKRLDAAERALGQCVAMKLLFGAAMPVIVYLFLLNPLLHLMTSKGVTAETLGYAHQYLAITLGFTVFSHLAFGLSACMRAEGAPRQSMYCMLTGCVTNILLDPFFIFEKFTIPGIGISLPGLGLKVAGAAWATNIAMSLACLVALRYYLSGKSVLHLRLRNIRFYPDMFTRVLSIGLAPFLMQMAASAIVFSTNRAFAHWSPSPQTATIQIAAYGIVQTVGMMFFMPCMGIQQGLGPIIGFNWGARNYHRVLRATYIGISLTYGITISAWVLQMIFAPQLARCFATDAGTLHACAFGIRSVNMMIWCIAINVTATTYYQSVGRPRTAIVLSLLRQCICLLPCIYLLPYLMPGHEILAIWLAHPISDVLANLATVPPFLKERRMLLRQAASCVF